MAKVKAANLNILSFNVLPRKVEQKGKRTKVHLAAILQPQYGLDGAEIVAKIKGRKMRFRYTRQLEQFIKELKLNKSDFKPLEEYLATELKNETKDVSLAITTLNNYLQSGVSPTFKVEYVPEQMAAPAG